MNFRCLFTNINPETGQRHPQHEPFKTLSKTRSILQGNERPVMGIQMGIRVIGQVSIGDAVYINDDNGN